MFGHSFSHLGPSGSGENGGAEATTMGRQQRMLTLPNIFPLPLTALGLLACQTVQSHPGHVFPLSEYSVRAHTRGMKN